MDSFQITVMAIATVILIGIFTVLGIILSGNTADKVYPPMANTCPDYWKVSPNDDTLCVVPSPSSVNSGKIYTIGADGNRYLNISAKKETGKILTPGLTTDADGVNVINFSNEGWGADGASPICAQKTWSGLTNIVWDGVSNYNSC
jgi:hypothetical protein